MAMRQLLASVAPMTEKPRGLSSSEAILARKRLGARPMETVRPVSSSIHFCSLISWKAGGRYRIEFPDGPGKPGTLDTEGGGTTTAGNQSRDTTGGEHFTLTPAEACTQ